MLMWKDLTNNFMAYRKTGTRDPNGTIAGSQKNRKTGALAGPQKNRKTGTRDPTKTGKLRPETLAGPSWSLHKFHKYISFTSQIVRLTASDLSDFALHYGFCFSCVFLVFWTALFKRNTYGRLLLEGILVSGTC